MIAWVEVVAAASHAARFITSITQSEAWVRLKVMLLELLSVVF